MYEACCGGLGAVRSIFLDGDALGRIEGSWTELRLKTGEYNGM